MSGIRERYQPNHICHLSMDFEVSKPYVLRGRNSFSLLTAFFCIKMSPIIFRIFCIVVLIVISNAFQFLKATANSHRLSSLRMQHERIVVTGLGVISPVGSSPNLFFDNLCNGVSGITKVDRFDAEKFKCQIAGQIKDFDPRAHYKSKKKIKQNDLSVHFAVAACHLALADAGIDLLTPGGKTDPNRVGVIVGSAFGGMDSFEKVNIILS